jgi:hypothetical protein
MPSAAIGAYTADSSALPSYTLAAMSKNRDVMKICAVGIIAPMIAVVAQISTYNGAAFHASPTISANPYFRFSSIGN